MTTRRGNPAYSLEIVVSDDQFARTGQIIADAPGPVDVREAGAKTSGWVRLVLTTESEHQLEDLESRLARSPERVNELTGKTNRVAVVTDGSAVASRGNLGPIAALPVMEGKAALLARLAGIDALPLCLYTDGPSLLAAADALASLTQPASATRLLPAVFDPRVVPAIAAAVQDASGAPRMNSEERNTDG